MITIQTHTMELAGTSYEIGTQLGKMVSEIPQLKAYFTGGFEGFGVSEKDAGCAMFDRWCPGLTEELRGFADVLNVELEQVLYYGMTYLLPRCSQIALLPDVTENGHPLLARNYEFSHEAEDFTLTRTSVKGKYTHMSTSVLFFGRADGFNECGLAVTMSSCGFPVGSLPYMRAPKLRGLQFWAVIRSVLENCRDVEEALDFVRDMPIAFNINLMLMDKSGHAALVETLDGRMEIKRIDETTKEQMLWATNHAVLPELAIYEPQAMKHSQRRFQWIGEQLVDAKTITPLQLKKMLLAEYPNGLCCHYFEEYFGTTKSMVIDPVNGTIELCWGGENENGWQIYDIAKPLERGTKAIGITLEKAKPSTYQFYPLE